MCALFHQTTTRQLGRLLCSGRRAVIVNNSMSKPPARTRYVASAPDNQLEQAVGAIEVLGNLQQATLQQQALERPVTGEHPGWAYAV